MTVLPRAAPSPTWLGLMVSGLVAALPRPWNWAPGCCRRCQMMPKMERPEATMARSCPVARIQER